MADDGVARRPGVSWKLIPLAEVQLSGVMEYTPNSAAASNSLDAADPKAAGESSNTGLDVMGVVGVLRWGNGLSSRPLLPLHKQLGAGEQAAAAGSKVSQQSSGK